MNTGTIIGNISNPNPSSMLDNRPGALVDAPVTINLGGGQLRNQGTLEVGGSGKVGQTTITGNLAQTSTGTLVLDVAPASNTSDHLQVNGTASLAGRIVPVVDDPAKLRPGVGQSLNILTATGGVTQSGTGVALASTPVVQYKVSATDANDLALNYNVDYSASNALQAAGLLSSNRSAVGHALNTILTSDAPAFSALQSLLINAATAQNVATLLDAVSETAAASAQQTAFAAQQAFTSSISRHVVGETRGSGTMSPFALASLDPVTTGPPANGAGVRVWVGGFGASDVLSGTDGQGSLHSQIAGAQLGLDKWFDADRMLGISVGGGNIDFSTAGGASQGQSTALNLGAYGLARFGDGYVSGVLSYGNYGTDQRRIGLLSSVYGPNAVLRGSFNTDVLGGQLELGLRRKLGGVTLTPFASLEVDHLWQSNFSQSLYAGNPAAGGLALTFARTQQTSVPLTLGGRVGSAFPVSGGRILELSAELGWVHEFNPQRSVMAAFVAAPNVPFRILGVSASRDAAQTVLDAKLSLTRNVALLGSVAGRFSGVETAIGGFAGVQVTW
ncbi:MAG: autotransporter domain-containing protein [Acetobacteraceae bacterium]|nr:autotransporter domain-containing protein [Acetobacteraceae bacterium]